MSDQKFIGSVKVMRSFDYCHFEVQLSSSEDKTLEEINSMRKEAARLVDKAVRQYAQFKKFNAWVINDSYERRRLRDATDKIMKIAESDWTPIQKAKVKLMADIDFHLSREYDYDDDWDDNYPVPDGTDEDGNVPF